jgi:hypothetical protein
MLWNDQQRLVVTAKRLVEFFFYIVGRLSHELRTASIFVVYTESDHLKRVE